MSGTSAVSPSNKEAAKLLELIQARIVSEAISVVATLGIPALLAEAPRSAEELAQAARVNAAYLRRVMRALVSFDIFAEDASGRFALTAVGQHLRPDADISLHSAAVFLGGQHGARMLTLFVDCVIRGESAAQMRFGTWTNWIQSDPELLAAFNTMMTVYSKIHLAGLFDAYDFSYGRRIVDVGGGHGRNLTEILKRNPQMHGILFDMPHALEGGRKAIAEAGLAARCEAVSGDFFVSVPDGADIYMLSRVIHDWNDEQSVAILKVIRKAIAPNGRLVLLEAMLGTDGESLYPVVSDLNMLLRTGGCERTEEEYRALYRAAGFELTRAVATSAPTGTTVIEGRPV